VAFWRACSLVAIFNHHGNPVALLVQHHTTPWWAPTRQSSRPKNRPTCYTHSENPPLVLTAIISTHSTCPHSLERSPSSKLGVLLRCTTRSGIHEGVGRHNTGTSPTVLGMAAAAHTSTRTMDTIDLPLRAGSNVSGEESSGSSGMWQHVGGIYHGLPC
jgi:hypothetical protein